MRVYAENRPTKIFKTKHKKDKIIFFLSIPIIFVQGYLHEHPLNQCHIRMINPTMCLSDIRMINPTICLSKTFELTVPYVRRPSSSTFHPILFFSCKCEKEIQILYK